VNQRSEFSMLRKWAVVVTAVSSASCAAPQTHIGSVSQDQIVIEQARQQQFALELSLKQQYRVQSVAVPLLHAAVPLCGTKVRPTFALIVGNAHRWKKEYFTAALSAGYNDTLVVMHVTPGFAAAEAGIREKDRILAVNGAAVATGARALDDFTAKLPGNKDKVVKPYTLTYRRGEDTATVVVHPRLACAYGVQVGGGDDVNAWADGQSIYLTPGILRFLANDDDLAVVVGHELAHDAMHHIDAQMKNSMLGALLGAVVDIAAATQGVNTGGDFTNQGAKLGSMVFSQDFEREADYVGLYVLALAGRPIQDAANVWREMGAAHPGSIKFATTHPTSAERFVRLNQWRGEIEQKVALGRPLMPEMKNGTTMVASVPSTPPTTVSQRSTSSPSSPSLTATAKTSTTSNSTDVGTRKDPESDRLISKPTIVAKDLSHVSKSVSKERVEPPPLRGAQAIIGAPSSESARDEATEAFAEGQAYMGSQRWEKAEQTFRRTLLLDGSVAKYHAALGSVLMVLRKYEEAEAEYTAAVLLDLDNPQYRKLVKQARSKR
jgi:beta-barrel assembly-enhancing protease